MARRVPEDLREASRYLVACVGDTGEVAPPDHSLTKATEYYLAAEGARLRMWPQLADQPHIEGLDLRLDAQAVAGAADAVWLVDDRGTPGIGAFTSLLERNGYVLEGTAALSGVDVLHFHRGP